MGYFPLAQCVCSRHLIMQNIWVEGATLVFFVFLSTVSLLVFLCRTFFVYPYNELTKSNMARRLWFVFLWPSVIVRWTNLLILVLFYGRKNTPFNVQLPSYKIAGVWIVRSVESEGKHFFFPTNNYELYFKRHERNFKRMHALRTCGFKGHSPMKRSNIDDWRGLRNL